MKQSYVIVNGKRFVATSGNDLIEVTTKEEIKDFLHGEKSIHAKYTKRIQELDELLKDAKFTAGRPKKQK